MTTGIEAVGALGAPQKMSLADVTSQTVADQRHSDLLSDMSSHAIKSAMHAPGMTAQEDKLKDQIAQESRGNPYVSGSEYPENPNATSDFFTDKMAGLYNEITIYQVAWNMAKRTGRDIETLLKAQ
jgi:hypothetical protein